DLLRVTKRRARRPVRLARLVEHRTAYTNAGVGLEVRAFVRRVVLRRVEQADHAGLDEILDLDVRGQTPDDVVSDALHELAVLQHELLDRHACRRERRAVANAHAFAASAVR